LRKLKVHIWASGEQAFSARRAGLSYSSIQRAEAAGDFPMMRTTNYASIVRVLTEAGVVFLDPGQPSLSGGEGVRLR